MSYFLHKSKPKLIDLELLKIYNNKIKDKYIRNNNNNYLNNILNIFKNYYGILSFIILFTILLYIRYIEVARRREKINKLLFKE
jgi:predicted PurR-regulated permease PerM